MHATTSAAIAGVASVALIVGSIVSAVRQARFARSAVATEGVVTALEPDAKIAHPKITFQAGDRLVTFRSGQTGHYAVGQKLTVYYDPADPETATLTAPAAARRTAILLSIPGIVLLPICVIIAVYVGPAESASERAARSFVDAVRKGTRDDAASLDHDAQSQIRAATEFHLDDVWIGFDDTACIVGELLPHRARLVLALVKVNGIWKVRRAAPRDPECDKRLDD